VHCTGGPVNIFAKSLRSKNPRETFQARASGKIVSSLGMKEYLVLSAVAFRILDREEVGSSEAKMAQSPKSATLAGSAA
jgi:hypothetical protein